MADNNALSLARQQFKQFDKLQRAGVKIRHFYYLTNDPKLDQDSIFIRSVADEYKGEPLPG